MKIKSLLFSIACSLLALSIQAQNKIPDGYEKATIQLFDGTTLTGYVKENIKKAASVSFIDETGSNKKQYEGDLITNLKIGEVNYICVGGDFFKTICTGKINFVQKASNASDKISYNGTEAVSNNGTEGRQGDYFVYADKKLTRINKKSVDAFIATNLAACKEAVEKAKTINGDIAKLQQPIEIFNTYTAK